MLVKTANTSELLVANPLLRLKSTRVLWNGPVKKLNSHGAYQKRIAAITSIGLFLYEERAFQRGYQLSRIIPYSEMTKVVLENDKFTIYANTKKESVVLSVTEQVVLVAMMYSITTALFGASCQFEFKDGNRQRVAEIDYKIETDCLAVDRFVTHCLATEVWKTVTNENVQEYIDMFAKESQEFVFTGKMAEGPFCQVIADTIAYDTTITELHLKNLNVCSFFPHLKKILTVNRTIKRLRFYGVTFIGSMNEIPQVTDITLPCDVMSFEVSDLSSPVFTKFIGNWQHFKTKITELVFKSDKLTDVQISAIVNAVTNYQSFEGLKKLSFELIDASESILMGINKLLASQWMEKIGCLNELILLGCGIDASVVVQRALMFEVSLDRLDLSRNNFTKPLDGGSFNKFNRLQILDLSDCKFTVESFDQLMVAFGQASTRPAVVDLSNIRLEAGNIDRIYDILVMSTVTGISRFGWSKNAMNPENAMKFIQFLASTRTMIDIDISEAIAPADMTECAPILCNYLRQSKLERLTFKGNPTSQVCDKSIYQIIETCCEMQDLQALDVRDQKLGDDGLDVLQKVLSNECITELHFDGSAPSCESLIDFCEKVMKSKIKTTEWPESDESAILLNTPLSQKNDVKRRLDSCKKEFVAKFGEQKAQPPTSRFLRRSGSISGMSTVSLLSSMRNPATQMPAPTLIPRPPAHNLNTMPKPATGIASIPLPTTIPTPIALSLPKEITYREEHIAQMMHECIGRDITDTTDDVFVKLFDYILEISNP